MRRRATFIIDDAVLEEIKIKAIKERKSYSDTLEEIIKRGLKR